jgi:hypothetical protein
VTWFEDRLRARACSRVGAPYIGQQTRGRNWIERLALRPAGGLLPVEKEPTDRSVA